MPENNISIPSVLNGTNHRQLRFHTAVDSVSLTRETTEKLNGFKVTGSVVVDQLETFSQRDVKDAFGNMRKVRLRSLVFDGIQFADIPIEIFDAALGRQKISVIGGGLIKQMNLVIDPAKHCLYLSPNRLLGMKSD